MGLLLSRSVEIHISNKTRNITLKNARIYSYCGRCTHLYLPELSPGSSGSCHFSGGFPFWGVAGVLVYEAESFTLAIYFSNPTYYNSFHMKMGLELSPGKAHLGRLANAYTRMAHGTNSSSNPDMKFNCVVVGKNKGTAQVSDGPIKVTATMSYTANSLLEVVLKEEEELEEEAGIENLRLESTEQLHFRHTTSRSENPQDLQGDLVDRPGAA